LELKHFTPEMPGRLQPIARGDHALVPNPLPPDWEMPQRLWPLIAEANRVIGVLEGIGRVLPNPAMLLRTTEDREAIQSSALEGTYATPKELLLFALEPMNAKSEYEAANRHREVFNYRRAIQHASGSDLPICLRLLRELHAILLEGVRGHHKDPGNFRRIQVAIGSNKRFVPPPPENVIPALDELEAYINNTSAFDPLIDCFLAHYQFETIHPFIDGNGRVGRLMMALMLQRKCNLTKPWLFLSDYFEKHRDEYIRGLYRISTEADWESWVEFCLRATIAQSNETVARCEKLLAVREQLRVRLNETGGHVRLHSIVDEIFNTPFVRVIDVQKRLNVTYPTARADLEKLALAGILKQLDGTKTKTYYAPDVYRVAYENISDEPESMRP
jgi:Fic family protein